MLAPRWHKVLRDLWSNKTRTVLVVLSIAVGVFAIGMITGTSEMMFRELAKGYERINPVQAAVYTDTFDSDLV
jgi:putative ABC transport system permease protein